MSGFGVIPQVMDEPLATIGFHPYRRKTTISGTVPVQSNANMFRW